MDLPTCVEWGLPQGIAYLYSTVSTKTIDPLYKGVLPPYFLTLKISTMRILLIVLLAPVLFFSCKTRTAEGKGESDANSYAMADGSAEFADMKYIETVRRNDIMFQNGNFVGWSKMFANDIIMQWSSGETIKGKQAVIDYWTGRWNTMVESITHENNIFLPVRMKESLLPGAKLPGVWLAQWTQHVTRYKNGKTVTGMIHADYHFNDDDLVDRFILYQDMAPTLAVTGEKSVVPAP